MGKIWLLGGAKTPNCWVDRFKKSTRYWATNVSLFKLFFRVNGGERDQTLRFYFDVDIQREELHWG